jgi:hypothetical protein
MTLHPSTAQALLDFIADDPRGLNFEPLAARLNCDPTLESVTAALRVVAGREAA